MKETLYFVKSWETDGIQLLKCCEIGDRGYVSWTNRQDRWIRYRGKMDRDFFRTREDAVAEAERRRERKIKSTERKLAKLKAMTFKEQA